MRTYRAPKAVRFEAADVDSPVGSAVRASVPLSLDQIATMLREWPAESGRAWAAHILERSAKMTNPDTGKRADMGTVLASADAAIDSAKLALEPLMGESDKAAMVYHLLCAADEALESLMDAHGVEDEDDEDDDDESEDAEETGAVNAAGGIMEERKAAIATAERLTMDTEIRAMDTEDGSLRIGGYAAMFNREATGLSFREQIAPGAFARSLESGQPVYLLINHDTDQLPLASTASGTMRLSEDQVGLRMEADLDPSNPRAVELASALRRGDVTKMSFAFAIYPGGEERAEDGLRTLTDLNLFEVSAVTWPAYDSSSIGMRTAEDAPADDLELRRRVLAARIAHARLR